MLLKTFFFYICDEVLMNAERVTIPVSLEKNDF